MSAPLIPGIELLHLNHTEWKWVKLIPKESQESITGIKGTTLGMQINSAAYAGFLSY